MNRLNESNEKGEIQKRIEQADEDWKFKRRDEAFVGVLNLVAMLASAISHLARKNIELSKAITQLQGKDPDDNDTGRGSG